MRDQCHKRFIPNIYPPCESIYHLGGNPGHHPSVATQFNRLPDFGCVRYSALRWPFPRKREVSSQRLNSFFEFWRRLVHSWPPIPTRRAWTIRATRARCLRSLGSLPPCNQISARSRRKLICTSRWFRCANTTSSRPVASAASSTIGRWR